MRVADLIQTIEETTEVLQSAAIARSAYVESCGDLLPEELVAHIGKLCTLTRLASTLAELAADTLAEES